MNVFFLSIDYEYIEGEEVGNRGMDGVGNGSLSEAWSLIFISFPPSNSGYGDGDFPNFYVNI